MMKKTILIYEEKGILTAKYYHKKSNDYLRYKAIIRIKESCKNPIEMHLTFDGIYPFVAPMPPEEHTIKAASILGLYIKLVKLFKRYGYELK